MVTSQFDKTLKRAGVDRSKIDVVRGWFKDSLTNSLSKEYASKKTKASVVWVDCDLYESSTQALNFIRPFLQNGTVVIFDDWYCYHANPEKGEMRAAAEFLKENSTIKFIPYHKFGIVGNSFIVNIKNHE